MNTTATRVTVRPPERRSSHAFYEVRGVWASLTIDLGHQRYRLNEHGQERATGLVRLYVQRAGAYAAEAPTQGWRCSWVVGADRIEVDGVLAQDARDCLMRLLSIVEDPRAETAFPDQPPLPVGTVTAYAAPV